MRSCVASMNQPAGRWSRWCCSPERAATHCCPGSSPRRWHCSSPPALWFYSWRVSMLPIFSSHGPRRVGVSSPCVRHWARADPNSSGSRSSTAASWLVPQGWRRSGSPWSSGSSRVAHCALWPSGRAVDSIRRPRHRGGGVAFGGSGARHRSAVELANSSPAIR